MYWPSFSAMYQRSFEPGSGGGFPIRVFTFPKGSPDALAASIAKVSKANSLYFLNSYRDILRRRTRGSIETDSLREVSRTYQAALNEKLSYRGRRDWDLPEFREIRLTSA